MMLSRLLDCFGGTDFVTEVSMNFMFTLREAQGGWPFSVVTGQRTIHLCFSTHLLFLLNQGTCLLSGMFSLSLNPLGLPPPMFDRLSMLVLPASLILGSRSGISLWLLLSQVLHHQLSSSVLKQMGVPTFQPHQVLLPPNSFVPNLPPWRVTSWGC